MSRVGTQTLTAALFIGLAMTGCGLKTLEVAGDAMAPTVKSGQDVVVNTAAYDSASPRRGDIIAFKLSHEFIARIVGLPGETITSSDGTVKVNGSVLSEPYLAAGTQTTAPQADYSVPATSYFVLFDNRSHVGDSRTFGPVPKSAIEGKVG